MDETSARVSMLIDEYVIDVSELYKSRVIVRAFISIIEISKIVKGMIQPFNFVPDKRLMDNWCRKELLLLPVV